MRWLVLFLFIIQAWASDKLLVFLGDGNCPWSEKVQKEVLENPQFLRGLRNEITLVPMNGQEKYFVEEMPTFILVNSAGEEAGRVGYMSLTASEYAQYFLEMSKSYAKTASLDKMNLEELQNLYQDAVKYHLSNQGKILEAGLAKDPGTFFLVERYAQLLRRGSRKAKEVRREIESRDYENKEESFFRLAVVDFQKRADELLSIDKTLKPLRRYLEEFGADWRVHMIMAQFLFGKEKIKDALEQARIAHEIAPEQAKNEVAETIRNIEGRTS